MAGRRRGSVTRKSSRLSSPATALRVESKDTDIATMVEGAEHGNQTSSLRDWVEPPLRNPVPSYEDHRGLERVGVLEHLQPLGQPPTQKILQKLKLAPPKSGRATPQAAPDQQTSQVNGRRPASAASTASPVPESKENTVHDESRQAAALTPSQRKVREKVDDEYRPAAPPPGSTVAKTKMTTRNSTSQAPTPLSSGGYIYHGHFHPQTIKQHVEAAIKISETQNPLLAVGLRRLCADSEVDPALWAVLDAILHKSHNKGQYKIFRRYIRDGQKESIRNRLNSNHAINPAAENPLNGTGDAGSSNHTPLIQQATTATTSKPTMSARRTKNRTTVVSSQSPSEPPSKSVPNSAVPSVPTLQIPQSGHSSPSRSPSALVTRPPSPTSALSAQSVQSLTPQIHSTPEESHEATIAPLRASVETFQAATAFEGEAKSVGNASQKRSQSVSSSSTLSSAKSLDAETFAPAMNRETRLNGTRRGGRPPLDQRQANARKASSVKSRGPRLGLFSVFPNANKTAIQKRAASNDIDDEELARRKGHLQEHQIFQEEYDGRYYAGESSERTTPMPVSPAQDVMSDGIASNIAPPRPVVHHNYAAKANDLVPSVATTLSKDNPYLRAKTGRKRTRDEVDAGEVEARTTRSSPTAPLVTRTAAALSVDRSGTPRGGQQPPAKRQRKSARVMVSPKKPKSSAGETVEAAPAGSRRGSRAKNSVESSEGENQDYCAACGRNGELLCCDGCPNSFHFTCLDPPMKGPPDGSWYCARCRAGQCVDINPKAFGLPASVREYFGGTKTGDEGAYEDVGMARTQTGDVKMNRAGFIEEPDLKRIKDGKGNLIVCYRCRLVSDGKRDIIPCDFCPTRWHLDCLDPPLAVPPRRRSGDKPNATWRCPLHVDGDLRRLGISQGSLEGKHPRHRIPRNAVPQDVTASRGFRNHGVIDVELAKDDEHIDEVDMHGTIYRLPEKGIQLDFLDRVCRERYNDAVLKQQSMTTVNNSTDQKSVLRSTISPDLGSVRAAAEPGPRSVYATDHAQTTPTNSTIRTRTLREQQAAATLQLLGQRFEQQQKEQEAQSRGAQEVHSSRMIELKSKPQVDHALELADYLVHNIGVEANRPADIDKQDEAKQLESLKQLIDLRLAALRVSVGHNSDCSNDADTANSRVDHDDIKNGTVNGGSWYDNDIDASVATADTSSAIHEASSDPSLRHCDSAGALVNGVRDRYTIPGDPLSTTGSDPIQSTRSSSTVNPSTTDSAPAVPQDTTSSYLSPPSATGVGKRARSASRGERKAQKSTTTAAKIQTTKSKSTATNLRDLAGRRSEPPPRLSPAFPVVDDDGAKDTVNSGRGGGTRNGGVQGAKVRNGERRRQRSYTPMPTATTPPSTSTTLPSKS